MDRVFLDANVLYAAAYKPASPLRRLWELADAELWTSSYATAEAVGNLLEDRPSQVPDLERLIGLLKLEEGTIEEEAFPVELALPAKDRPILNAAIRARATHLLTGDKAHFGPYFGRTVGGVLILPPSEYLRTRPEGDTARQGRSQS